MAATPSGRRERGKDAKRTRIFSAAAELFDKHGFDAVTTREIAERADVAAGTLFRYAANKSELLLMVYNDAAAEAFETGSENAAQTTDSVERVLALVEPFIVEGRRQHENAVVYQRELLFGSATDEYRAQGLDIVARMERAIAGSLLHAAPASLDVTFVDDHEVLRAARAIFALVHMAIVYPLAQHDDQESLADSLSVLRTQVELIVVGLTTIADRRSDLCVSNGQKRTKND